jgi:hypothetical protein
VFYYVLFQRDSRFVGAYSRLLSESPNIAVLLSRKRVYAPSQDCNTAAQLGYGVVIAAQ